MVWLCSSLLLAVSVAADSSEINATPAAVVKAGAGRVLLRVVATHARGASQIDIVAAEVLRGDMHTMFPALYDDGTNGDAVASDGVYSIEVSVAGPGERFVVYYVVDASGAEVVTEPAAFTLE